MKRWEDMKADVFKSKGLRECILGCYWVRIFTYVYLQVVAQLDPLSECDGLTWNSGSCADYASVEIWIGGHNYFYCSNYPLHPEYFLSRQLELNEIAWSRES